VIQTISSPRVVCRPALPRDGADVKEFCKHIWGGQDYVQYAWDEWIADPDGILAFAEYAGHAIGLAKVTLLAPEQWWLEGFRVDPRFQGLKIGSHIHRYIDAWWLKHGSGVVRLMTSSQRVQVQHLCEKLYFEKIGEVIGVIASPLDDPVVSFQLLKKSAIPTALQLIRLNPTLTLCNNLLDRGWRFITPDYPTLQELVEKKRVWTWRGQEGLLLDWTDEGEQSGYERQLAIGLPACHINALPEFLMDVRRLAAKLGYEKVFWSTPVRDELDSIFGKTGFEHDWDHPAFIYEKRRPTEWISGIDKAAQRGSHP